MMYLRKLAVSDNEASLKAAINAGGKIIKTENGRYCVGL